jgi:DNA repair exonuclease SbcCD ATPase subunit
MVARQKDMEEIKAMLRTTATSARSALNTGSTIPSSEGELEMSVLQADREVLQDTLSGVRAENRRLLDEVVKLKVQLKRAKKEREFMSFQGRPADAVQRSKSAKPQMFGPPQPTSPSGSNAVDATSTCSTIVTGSEVTALALTGRWSGGFEDMMNEDPRSRLVTLEHQVHMALEELVKKDQVIAGHREELERLQMMERELAKQLKTLAHEHEQVKREHSRLELQNNRLQGYLLDGMSGEELNQLIYNLTTAAERVRLSVQLRKIQTATSPPSGHDSNKESSEAA